MCCGSLRQPISSPPRPTDGSAPPGVPPASAARRQRRSGVTFEYEGRTTMTVVSPLTRRSYRFAHPGARIVADPHDTAWLTFTPNLRRAG